MAIVLVGQGYESIEEHHNYKTGTRTTYGGQGQPMTISKTENQSVSIVTSMVIW